MEISLHVAPVQHKNINDNEPDDINENKWYENTVAYVSDIRVSTEGPDLRWSYR